MSDQEGMQRHGAEGLARRPTNYEKYFGTSELAAATTVEPQANADGSQWVAVWHCGEVVGTVKARYYPAWLKQRAD